MKEVKLHNNHWTFEDFKQRMTRKEWQWILLNHKDMITFKGHVRDLKAIHIGVGVYEVFKKPLSKVVT